MAVASGGGEDKPREEARTERRSTRTHESIVAGARKGSGACAVGDTRRKDRSLRGRGSGGRRGLNPVDAFDAENAGDSADVGANGFELAAVDNFQAGRDARILMVGAAFDRSDVRAGAADDGGNFREKAGAGLGANGEFDGKGGRAGTAPFDGDAALGLIEKILHIGAGARVHSNPAATRDVAHDFVAGNGIAAFGAVDEQIV